MRTRDSSRSLALGLLPLMALVGFRSEAAQFGPLFPSHRFPTDESFHAGYRLSRGASSSNFIETLQIKDLLNRAELTVWKHEFQLEYQPSREISIGALFLFDQTRLAIPQGAEASSSGLGDQRLWGEFRFFDEPGASLGLAIMAKFPGYKGPEAAPAGGELLTLPGDAQSDFTTLVTSEYWPSDTFRLRADFGYTFRSEGFSDELPYLISAGFVVPKLEIDLKIRGNFSMGNDEFTDPKGVFAEIRKAFGDSDYAYSSQPSVLVLNPTLEIWINPRWAVGIDFHYSFLGSASPSFTQYGVSVTYRWAKTHRKSTRTFKEVDIGTDQESGRFQGESQDGDAVLKAEDPTPIRPEPDDEIFN